jgi:hypothetical protein
MEMETRKRHVQARNSEERAQTNGFDPAGWMHLSERDVIAAWNGNKV